MTMLDPFKGTDPSVGDELDAFFGWDGDAEPAATPKQEPLPTGTAASVLGVPVIKKSHELEVADIRPLIQPASDGALLQDAKETVLNGVLGKDGVVCPCCDRRANIYNRKFTHKMGRALLWLVESAEEVRNWVDKSNQAPQWVTKLEGDFARMEKWGLIERWDSGDEKRGPGKSGFWRPTERGVLFAQNKLRIPDSIFLLMNVVVGESPNKVSITDRLPAGFDYRELWT